MPVTKNYSEILIVDDDSVMCFLEERVLLALGVEVPIHTFNGGEGALIHIEESSAEDKHHLVFLDINMPNMDGWEFLNQIEKSRHPENVWVIMVSSAVGKVEREKASRYSQVLGYLEKPMTVESLSSVLDQESLNFLQPVYS